jgi:hypothetical protein
MLIRAYLAVGAAQLSLSTGTGQRRPVLVEIHTERSAASADSRAWAASAVSLRIPK